MGKTFYHYQAYKEYLAKFIQSNVSNIYDIEGFFGFAPYSSAPLRTSSYGDRERGGKVFQNNHESIGLESDVILTDYYDFGDLKKWGDK